MGKAIKQWSFSPEDYAIFQDKLYQQLESLKRVIQAPKFGQAPLKFGAELEMYLVDQTGNVSFNNLQLLEQLNDDQFQPELNTYNLELNLSAVDQTGTPFSLILAELQDKASNLAEVAADNDTQFVPIGILPTLRYAHLDLSNMTNIPRYHNLAKHLTEQRGDPFEININGEETLEVTLDSICAEGANTSFQVHMMIPPERFCQVFNAAQISAALVTAITANSPIFLGNRLWDETRIALFKQALDIRHFSEKGWQEPTRVNFGFGWLRNSPWELFAEAVALYPVILPAHSTEENEESLPALEELSLHMGTIWPWHRPVYSNDGNGHIRMEFRALPAGPTNIDMMANAAFAIGLANGLADQIEQLISVMPFKYAEYNFYRAAQSGLDAEILWPFSHPSKLEEVPVTQVIERMLPIAQDGLIKLGIDSEEAQRMISFIHDRLVHEITGAIWQKKTLTHFEKTLSRSEACQQVVLYYQANYSGQLPLTEWERPWL